MICLCEKKSFFLLFITFTFKQITYEPGYKKLKSYIYAKRLFTGMENLNALKNVNKE